MKADVGFPGKPKINFFTSSIMCVANIVDFLGFISTFPEEMHLVLISKGHISRLIYLIINKKEIYQIYILAFKYFSKTVFNKSLSLDEPVVTIRFTSFKASSILFCIDANLEYNLLYFELLYIYWKILIITT